MSRKKNIFRSQSSQGFSLIEILVVISLIVVVAGLTAPTLMKSFQTRSLEQEIGKVSDLLELARSAAISKNSYVIVGVQEFRPPERANAGIAWMVWTSKKGGKITKETPLEELIPLSKLIWLENAHLAVSDLASGDQGVGYFEKSESALTVNRPEIDEFSRSIQFSPRGTVSIDTQQVLYRYIQIDLLPVRGEEEILERRLLLQINGITGLVKKVLPKEGN